MTYSFSCLNPTHNCPDFDKDYSFKEFDQIKAGTLKVPCEVCGGYTEMIMGGIGVYIYDATPKTLGGLADRNTKYRLPQVEEEEDKKREAKKAAGKWVPPKEINIPWDAPEKPKFDKKERKERRKEATAKKYGTKKKA